MKKYKNSYIICGFPGIGKSYYTEKYKDEYNIVDLDSSYYSKDSNGNRNKEFPYNYLDDILDYIDEEYDIIFISTHREVRDILEDNDIDFNIIYPNIIDKEYYINEVYQGRDKKFIELMKDKWEEFIKDIEDCNYDNEYILYKNMTLEDIIDI